MEFSSDCGPDGGKTMHGCLFAILSGLLAAEAKKTFLL
jgi:hypothetical protein